MANRVTISTFSAPPPALPQNTPPDKTLAEMTKFWQAQIDKVLPDRPDLIVLPEVCDQPAGWTPELCRQYYDARGDRLQEFFAGVAKKNSCYITCSAVRAMPDGTGRNSIVLLDRSGNVAGVYHKNHVTIGENEDHHLLYGKDAPIMECDFGRVACAICFDLNFDELRLKYVAAKPDLVIFSSMYHGGLMQAYWAYSCRAHFVASVYDKPSAILAPTGETLATTTNYFAYVTATVNLDCGLFHLDGHWEKLDAIKAKYRRKVTVHDPGFLAPVLVTSETDELTVDDLIREFEMEPLGDYFARALAHRHAPGRIEK